MKVAVYGSLLSGLGNHRVMLNAKGVLVEETILSGFSIYDRHCGFPFAKKSKLKSDKIKVEIYEVADDMIHHLDRLEGYNPERPLSQNMYVRHLIKGTDISIYIYNQPITLSFNKVEGGDWRKFFGETY